MNASHKEYARRIQMVDNTMGKLMLPAELQRRVLKYYNYVWNMHGMIPIGYPTGKWGVPRRRPAHEAVYVDTWGQAPEWTADDPLWTAPY